jgi:DNA-binding MarR family transcriptional regulator
MTVGRSPYCGCLYYSANALARKVKRMAEEVFRPTGLPPSHGFVVMTVNKQPGITAGEIAAVMQLQPSTVTRLVDKLEDEGFLTRQTDGKFIRMLPTAKATRLDAGLRLAWQNLYKRYTALLGEQQSRDLTSAIYEAAMTLGDG